MDRKEKSKKERPESMWQWPIAWTVCWLSPFRWLKNLQARLCASEKELGSVGSQRFTISLTVKRAWYPRCSLSPSSCLSGAKKWCQSNAMYQHVFTQMWQYLNNVNKHLKFCQQLPDIPVENHQLSFVNRKSPVWVWSCNHGSLSSSKQPIASHLHV